MNKIKTRRIKKGLSQIELAKKLNVTQSQISRLEADVARVSDLPLRLAKVLGGRPEEYVHPPKRKKPS